jgi:hypothetical protein
LDDKNLQQMLLTLPPWKSSKRLSKQLSICCETSRDIAWDSKQNDKNEKHKNCEVITRKLELGGKIRSTLD